MRQAAGRGVCSARAPSPAQASWPPCHPSSPAAGPSWQPPAAQQTPPAPAARPPDHKAALGPGCRCWRCGWAGCMASPWAAQAARGRWGRCDGSEDATEAQGRAASLRGQQQQAARPSTAHIYVEEDVLTSAALGRLHHRHLHSGDAAQLVVPPPDAHDRALQGAHVRLAARRTQLCREGGSGRLREVGAATLKEGVNAHMLNLCCADLPPATLTTQLHVQPDQRQHLILGHKQLRQVLAAG